MVTSSTKALQGFSYVHLSAIAIGDVIKPFHGKPFTVSGIIHDEEDGVVYFTNHNKKGERVQGQGFALSDSHTMDTIKVARKD